MSGVKIELLDSNGNVIATTVTDANGYYHFDNLPQGSYTIKETQPFGYLDLNQADGDYPNNTTTNTIKVYLDPSENDDDNDFEEKLGSSIGNYVWYDANANGLQDSNEHGVNGVTVYLLDGNGNPVLNGNGTPMTTTTDSSGYYLFDGLIPGDFIVVFAIPNGTTITPAPKEGSNGSIDSDTIEVVNGMASVEVTIALGENNLDIDMGLVYLGTASIGDIIWIDSNSNGIQDAGEKGLDGVTVILYDANGVKLETQITHDGGKYLFEHLYAGEYSIEIILGDDWVFTGQNATNSFESDSDVNVANGFIVNISLEEGEHQHIWDAGVYCACEDAVNKSDSAPSLSLIGAIIALLLSIATALYFIRKEEEAYNALMGIRK